MSLVPAIRDEGGYLAVIADLRDLLRRVESVADAAELADRARLAEVWAQRAHLGRRQVNLAAAAKLFAEWRAGELLSQLISRGGDRRSGSKLQTATLNGIGVTKRESAKWQKLSKIPSDEFACITNGLVEEGIVSAEAIMKKAGRRARNEEAKQSRRDAEEAARSHLAEHGDEVRLEVADIREWRPAGVDAIVTDPPYITDDAVDLHSSLADFALDVLPDGGALVVMTWQKILPEVLVAMARPGLSYRWTVAWVYDTPERTPEHQPRVFDGWKPILVFHKGEMPADATFLYDVVRSPASDKESHEEWGQSVDGFRQLVRAVTSPGGTVCDPFLGGGTTAVAAAAEARRFVGADIEPRWIETTRARLDG